VWQHYKAAMEEGGHRVISRVRWRQYIQRLFSGVHKNRTCEDLCDSCVRIEMELKRTDLTDDERTALEEEKNAHLGAAKAQRQAMNDAIKIFARKNGLVSDADLDVPELPLDVDELTVMLMGVHLDEHTPNYMKTVLIQAEDFGGGLTMPWYGKDRPSAD
jgi:hypothetical protein